MSKVFFSKPATYDGIKERRATIDGDGMGPALLLRQTTRGSTTWKVINRYYDQRAGDKYSRQYTDILNQGSLTEMKQFCQYVLLERCAGQDPGGKLIIKPKEQESK